MTACLESDSVERCVVTTDDEEIAAAGELAGATVVMRPVALATDRASSESAVLHALDQLESTGWGVPKFTLLVQCTSPFVIADDVDAVVQTMKSEEADSCLTVSRTHGFLWKRDTMGVAVAINHDQSNRLPRQELPPEYLETGSVYGFLTEGFRTQRRRFFGRVALAEVDPLRTIEVDDQDDLLLAEMLASTIEGPTNQW